MVIIVHKIFAFKFVRKMVLDLQGYRQVDNVIVIMIMVNIKKQQNLNVTLNVQQIMIKYVVEV